MTPFRAAAAFAILLAGAGSAQAGPTSFATVGGYTVDPAYFGGFENFSTTVKTPAPSPWTLGTPGVITGGSVQAPTTVGVNNLAGHANQGSNYLRVSDHSNTNSSLADTAQRWTYVGLSGVAAPAGSVVTVTAYAAGAVANDLFGIFYGTPLTSSILPTTTPVTSYANAQIIALDQGTTARANYQKDTLTFTVSSNFDVYFGFYDILPTGTGVGQANDYTYLDSVSITYPTPAPEPASLALLGAGLLGLGLARRRKHA